MVFEFLWTRSHFGVTAILNALVKEVIKRSSNQEVLILMLHKQHRQVNIPAAPHKEEGACVLTQFE